MQEFAGSLYIKAVWGIEEKLGYDLVTVLTRIKEIISVRDTIKSKEEYILNYFNNRSTNASAESFNSKVKGLRAQVHGVNDLPFFMFRCAKIFG